MGRRRCGRVGPRQEQWDRGTRPSYMEVREAKDDRWETLILVINYRHTLDDAGNIGDSRSRTTVIFEIVQPVHRVETNSGGFI